MKLTDQKLEALLQKLESDVQVPGDLNSKILEYVEERTRKVGFWEYFRLHRFASALVLVIFLVGASGAGVTLAAESAVPGQKLYAVKTLVNEPIRQRLQLTEESKASFAVEMVERRIVESVVLEESAVESGLTQPTEEQIQLYKRLQGRVAEAKERLKAMEARGDFERAQEIRKKLRELEALYQERSLQ